MRIPETESMCEKRHPIADSRSRRALVAASWFLLLVAPTSRAQSSARPLTGQEPLPVVSTHRGVYDFGARKLDLGVVPSKSATGVFCYVNTDTVGFYTSVSPGSEFIDWGILGGTTGTSWTKCEGVSDIVSSFTFSYGTFSPDPSQGGPGASLTLLFYEDFQGFGQDSGNCPVATFAFSGLPGYSGSTTGVGAAYEVQVDLTGGEEFCLPDGKFGFGYRADGGTGPLLCLAGDGAGGLEPCTGTIDAFDIWSPDTKGINVGTFFFGGPPNNFFSWDLALARADLSGSPAAVEVRNAAPNPPGSLSCTAGVLGGILEATIVCPPGYTTALCFGFDTPVAIPLGGGQVLLTADLGGSGEILTGAGLAAGFVGTTVGGASTFGCSTPVPKNLELCGYAFSLQALCALGVTPFLLTSACDLTLGG